MTLPAAATAPAPFRDLPGLVAEHARSRPQATALVVGDQRLTYATLDALADRVAAGLQRDGLQPGERVAVCAGSSPAYVAVFLGTLRLAGEMGRLRYGEDAQRDQLGVLQAIGPGHWRIALPWPRWTARLVLIELRAA